MENRLQHLITLSSFTLLFVLFLVVVVVWALLKLRRIRSGESEMHEIPSCWTQTPRGAGIYIIVAVGDSQPSAAELVDDGEGRMSWHIAGRYCSSDQDEIRLFLGPLIATPPE
jgi:hypothetical protein